MTFVNIKDIKTLTPEREEVPFWTALKASEMTFTAKTVNVEALMESLEATPAEEIRLEFKTVGQTNTKLHKKKRISKKWAKQGKTRPIYRRFTTSGAISDNGMNTFTFTGVKYE